MFQIEWISMAKCGPSRGTLPMINWNKMGKVNKMIPEVFGNQLKRRKYSSIQAKTARVGIKYETRFE